MLPVVYSNNTYRAESVCNGHVMVLHFLTEGVGL